MIDAAHQAAADFVGASDAGTIAFGGNMTSLTFALSRALARTWNEGDEIVLSHLEHDANFRRKDLSILTDDLNAVRIFSEASPQLSQAIESSEKL